jgi:acetyl esterase
MRTLIVLLTLLTAPVGAETVKMNIPYVTRATGPLLLDASVPDGPGPFPAVILVHGGGFTRGSKITYIDPMFQPLTRAGFAWFTIDYRMGPGVTIEDMIADTQAALNFVYDNAAEYHVNRKKIVLLGESAGGFLVDYVALKNTGPATLAGLVSFYSPADMSLVFPKPRTVSPGPTLDPFGVGSLAPEAKAQHLHDLSPFYMVRKGLPPTLVLHGSLDEQVPFIQGLRFCDALKVAGNKCELYVVEGGLHGMGQWEENSKQLGYKEKVVTWLTALLK